MDIEDVIAGMFGCEIKNANDTQNHTYSFHTQSFNEELINEIYTFVKSKNPYKLSVLKSGNYAITLNDKIIDKLYCDDLIEAKYEYIIKVMES